MNYDCHAGRGWRVALLCITLVLGSAGAVAASSDERSPHPATDADANVMDKFDPALRMQLGADPEAEISAMVSLSEPLSEAELDTFREQRVRILSARENRLHVQARPEALLSLAEHPAVESLSQSGPMRPPR